MIAGVVLLAFWVNACINYRTRKRLMGVEFDLDGNPITPVHEQRTAGAEAS
jgi:hypothetical protein